MKKNKKSIKKLALNKKVVSNLENSQVNGGLVVTVFCVTQLNCPTLRFNCKTLDIRDCLVTTTTTTGTGTGTIQTIGGSGCQSVIDGCQTDWGCF